MLSGDHAFLYSAGAIQDLGTLGGSDSSGWALNDSGDCVGTAYTVSAYHAFLYSNGVMHDLGSLPGYEYSGAIGINASGQIIGNCYNGGPTQAFLYSNGVMQSLGTLGGIQAQAFGINSSAEIVGDAILPNNDNVGMVYLSGAMYDPNTLLDASSQGIQVQHCQAVNDSGLIVGYGAVGGNAPSFALLLTPIGANVIVPNFYSILVGTQSGGSLYSIQFNDPWYLTVQPGAVTLLSEAPAQIQVSGTSPTASPTTFQFTFTGHVNSINLSQSIQLYNFDTSAYETLNTTAAHVGSDSTVTVTPTGDLTRFVNQSTGEVRAKVNFSRVGAVSVLRWTASLGVANWIIQ